MTNKSFGEWVKDIPTLVKVGVVAGAILAGIAGVVKIDFNTNKSVAVDQHILDQNGVLGAISERQKEAVEVQRETNRLLYIMTHQLGEIKGKLDRR